MTVQWFVGWFFLVWNLGLIVMNLVNLARSRRLLREAEKTHADATALLDELRLTYTRN